MATFYILFSKSIDRYYVGSCLDLEKRISEHNVLRVGDVALCCACGKAILLTRC
jgi:hypothetical protein